MTNKFKPTWLYIKTHNITGLKYFGKTTLKEPYKYKGSGIYWKRHIKKHGNDVTTEIIGIFTDKIWCMFYALEFSDSNDIVDSEKWANLIPEDALDGGARTNGFAPAKILHTQEYIGLISIHDIRWNSSEIVGVNHGIKIPKINMAMAKIKSTNNCVGWISKDDPLWISGELVGVTAGTPRENHWGFGKSRTQDTRHKISKNHQDCSGKNNSRAKDIYLKSPSGAVYPCFGDFKNRCIELNLSVGTMLKLLYENKIPKSGRCFGWTASYDPKV